MRILALLLLGISLLFSTSTISYAAVDKENVDELNLQNGAEMGDTEGRDTKLGSFQNSVKSQNGDFSYFQTNSTGSKGVESLLFTIAKSMKNIALLLAVFYLIFSVYRLLFSGAADDDIKKWKLSIIWTTLGIILMQSSFAFVETLNYEDVDGNLALRIMKNIIFPFLSMLQALASFAFIAMAIYAFYRIVTSGGDEEGAKAGKRTVIYAIIGFALLKIPQYIIDSTYGRVVSCSGGILSGDKCIETPQNLSGLVKTIANAINYINGFLMLVVLVLIIYAGFLVLTSGGDDEKMKRAKSIIKYAIIGVLLIVSSYMLFNLFLVK